MRPTILIGVPLITTIKSVVQRRGTGLHAMRNIPHLLESSLRFHDGLSFHAVVDGGMMYYHLCRWKNLLFEVGDELFVLRALAVSFPAVTCTSSL